MFEKNDRIEKEQDTHSPNTLGTLSKYSVRRPKQTAPSSSRLKAPKGDFLSVRSVLEISNRNIPRTVSKYFEL